MSREHSPDSAGSEQFRELFQATLVSLRDLTHEGKPTTDTADLKSAEKRRFRIYEEGPGLTITAIDFTEAGKVSDMSFEFLPGDQVFKVVATAQFGFSGKLAILTYYLGVRDNEPVYAQRILKAKAPWVDDKPPVPTGSDDIEQAHKIGRFIEAAAGPVPIADGLQKGPLAEIDYRVLNALVSLPKRRRERNSIDPEDLEIASEKTKSDFLELVKAMLESKGHDLGSEKNPITDTFPLSEKPLQSLTVTYNSKVANDPKARSAENVAEVIYMQDNLGKLTTTFFHFRKDGNVDRDLDEATGELVSHISEEETARRLAEYKRDIRLGIPRVSDKRLRGLNELMFTFLNEQAK